MTLGSPRSGANWAAAYRSSGYPWVTGSVAIASDETQKIAFDTVTKYFRLSNRGTVPLRVGFTLNGISGSYFYTVEPSEETSFDLKVRDLYLKNTGSLGGVYDLVAGVTGIRRTELPNLTGSSTPLSGSMYTPNIG